MLRRSVKSGLAAGLAGIGADAWIGAWNGTSRRPLVVGYHRVVADYAASAGTSLPGMIVGTAMLEAHLDWIARRYAIKTLDEIGALLATGAPLEKPVAAVTFDDGYADVYENAEPLLRRKGIPATVFVVTDLVGTERLNLHDSLYLLLTRFFAARPNAGADLARLFARAGLGTLEARPAARDAFAMLGLLLHRLPRAQVLQLAEALEAEIGIERDESARLRSLSWPMLRAMQARGIEIGSHGRTHALLPNETERTMRDELVLSRLTLERELELPVRAFAYPGGHWNAPAVSAVAAAGYSYGFTICGHVDPRHPLLTISRRMLWEGSCVDGSSGFSAAVMSCQARGVFDLVQGCRSGGHATPKHAASGQLVPTREARR